MDVTNDDKVRCPKCNSDQITANKKGFGISKAVGGAILTGGVGLLAGTIGAGKIIITCLKCGHKFKPGQKREVITPQLAFKERLAKNTSETENKTPAETLGCAILVIAVIALLIYWIAK